ncbi:hypothetical protein DFH08DRAFT_798739 [Mycena albidolilacea]|uniref:Uncharacterized protein n=1 Tax=Mycena albidolilacea TaxID=1033008 RepID=A0AAD7API5_9AGAR|nr:hypothetical protein DFH08DRAFT_798739 [Mycena albidolilacea]
MEGVARVSGGRNQDGGALGNDSDTAHLSASEPEREATSCKRCFHTLRPSIKNRCDRKTSILEHRLAAIEREPVGLKRHMQDVTLPCTPPSVKWAHIMRDTSVGGDSPMGAVDSSIHRSCLRASTPERDELSRQLEEDFLRTQDRHLQ